ncbi:Protein ral2 [Smittium mucronatum]|uniref:Protein ral2 n=1 Tax=Smittium mucronatum TaxID=133383 RepID=A0A1R0H3J3_9FUNG|nr:Protein ral2 [Smittium mucronatum]
MELERYISGLKKQKGIPPEIENLDKDFLLQNCAGNVPPATTGSTLTYINGRVYFFGGKLIDGTRVLSDIYVYDVYEKKWRLIKASKSELKPKPEPSATLNGLERDESVKRSRFFHSAIAYKNYLVIFGGIGVRMMEINQTAKIKNNPSNIFFSKKKNISVFKLFSSTQSNVNLEKMQLTKKITKKRALLNDIIAFDTVTEKWVDDFSSIEESFVSSDSNSGFSGNSTFLKDDFHFDTFRSKKQSSVDKQYTPDLQTMIPQPRYAHVSCLIYGSKMVVVGGQGLTEEYVKEYNVFDFKTKQWVQKKYMDSEISKYRSSIFGISDGSALIFSNYNFGSVNHDFLKVHNQESKISISKIDLPFSGTAPPGIKFPICRLVDKNTMIVSGISMSNDSSSLSTAWTFNLQTKVWKGILNTNGKSKKLQGSWNESVMSGITQQLLIFGNSARSMTKDYKQRRSNFEQCMEIDLLNFGFSRNKTCRSDVFFSDHSSFVVKDKNIFNSQSQKTFSDALISSQRHLDFAQLLGTQILTMQQFADTWIETTDGKWIPVNSDMIRHRNSALCEIWGISSLISDSSKRSDKDASFVNNQSIIDMGGLASSTNINSNDSNRLSRFNSTGSVKDLKKKRLEKKSSLVQLSKINKNIYRAHVSVPEASDVIIPLIKFLYTGNLEVSPNILSMRSSLLGSDQLVIQKRTITILSRLISIGRKTDFVELVASSILLLCQQVDSNSALIVLDAVHQLKIPHVENLCLCILRNFPRSRDRKNSFIWNSISESTRYYVESKINGQSI